MLVVICVILKMNIFVINLMQNVRMLANAEEFVKMKGKEMKKILKILNWGEWLSLLLCVAFCIFAFIDQEYIAGTIFTVFTVIGTVNSVRANLKNKEKR